MNPDYPRNLIGYGNQPPHPNWPNQAKIALQFVLNYEEGGENSVLHGDEFSETFLSEIIGAKPYPARHPSMESLYEYGSRAGVWRILKLFQEFDIPITIFAVSMAIDRNRPLATYLADNEYDICCHGYRWIDYQFMDEKTEREHMDKAVQILENCLGKKPIGWYTGRNSPNTRKILWEKGGFLYDSDDYSDDLPFWLTNEVTAEPHLVIPYTLDTNDMRFASPQGFNSGEQFYQYLKDAFDTLYLEGVESPKILNIGMHCRILGRPARLWALRKFLNYTKSFDQVWYATRAEIAHHWKDNFKTS